MLLPRHLHTSGLTFISSPIPHRQGSKVNLLRDETLLPGAHGTLMLQDQVNQDGEESRKGEKKVPNENNNKE